jgi:hypothetical protein
MVVFIGSFFVVVVALSSTRRTARAEEDIEFLAFFKGNCAGGASHATERKIFVRFGSAAGL